MDILRAALSTIIVLIAYPVVALALWFHRADVHDRGDGQMELLAHFLTG